MGFVVVWTLLNKAMCIKKFYWLTVRLTFPAANYLLADSMGYILNSEVQVEQVSTCLGGCG